MSRPGDQDSQALSTPGTEVKRVGVAAERVYVLECTECGVLTHLPERATAIEERTAHIAEHRERGDQARPFRSWATADRYVTGVSQ